MSNPYNQLFNQQSYKRVENTSYFEPNSNLPNYGDARAMRKNHRSIWDNTTEANELSLTYFGQPNIDRIQKILMAIVNDKLKTIGATIGPQDQLVLETIMNEVYKIHSNFTQTKIPAEIERLNYIVVQEASKIVLSNITLHLKFLRDKSSAYGGKVIDNAQMSSVKGTRLDGSPVLETAMAAYRSLDVRSLLPPLPKLY